MSTCRLQPSSLLAVVWCALVAIPSGVSTAAEPDASAAPRVYACRIGKPSYCFKYGGSRCQKLNSKGRTPAGVEKNCDAWTAACLDCHAEIPPCLGGVRPAQASPGCLTCTEKWHACMDRIDAAHWPNRRQPR